MKTAQAIRLQFWRRTALLFLLKTALLLSPNIEAQQISALPQITTLATNDLGIVVDVSATPPVTGTTKKFFLRQLADLFATNNMPALITTGRVDAARFTINTNGTEALIMVALPSGEVQVLNGAGGNINFFSDTGFEFNNQLYAPILAAGSGIAITNLSLFPVSSFSTPSTANPLALSASQVYGNVIHYGVTGEVDLPAGAVGMNLVIYCTGTFVITVDPNGSETIVRNGTLQGAGVSVTLTGTAGSYVSFYWDGARWITLGYYGILAQGS